MAPRCWLSLQGRHCILGGSSGVPLCPSPVGCVGGRPKGKDGGGSLQEGGQALGLQGCPGLDGRGVGTPVHCLGDGPAET